MHAINCQAGEKKQVNELWTDQQASQRRITVRGVIACLARFFHKDGSVSFRAKLRAYLESSGLSDSDEVLKPIFSELFALALPRAYVWGGVDSECEDGPAGAIKVELRWERLVHQRASTPVRSPQRRTIPLSAPPHAPPLRDSPSRLDSPVHLPSPRIRFCATTATKATATATATAAATATATTAASACATASLEAAGVTGASHALRSPCAGPSDTPSQVVAPP